jgi:predicted HTH domain antitoxin
MTPTETERLQVNIRLERELVDELDELARAESLDKAELVRRLLRDGLKRERSRLALDKYREGGISAGRAAEVARISLYEMLDRIHQAGIPYELDPDELVRIRDRVPPRRVRTAAREASTPYSSSPPAIDSDIEELRRQFRPDRVRWLFIGESSPAGGTHFYRANSNLFRATQAAFAQAFGQDVPPGAAFLHDFRARGAWLVDIANRPVNHLEAGERARAVAAGVDRLSDVIAETKPDRIFVVKASIARDVRKAAGKAGHTGEIVELPFPVRQWRTAYSRELARALGASSS